MKVKEKLTFGLLIPKRMTAYQDGFDFFSLLFEELPEFAPEFYGNFEPINTTFESIDVALTSWRIPFLWKRKKNLNSNGSAWIGNPNCHSAIYLCTAQKNYDIKKVESFIKKMILRFSVDFAYIHYHTQSEVDQQPYEVWKPFEIGLTTHDLRKGIPLISWGMILGKPYKDIIEFQKLHDSSFYTEDISEENIYIKLSDNIVDMKNEYNQIEKSRAVLTSLMGEELFFNRGNIKIPTFKLET